MITTSQALPSGAREETCLTDLEGILGASKTPKQTERDQVDML